MSGRLTPAAATAMSTSPIAGIGIGRVVGCRTSGPPGLVISIAVMVGGRVVIASILDSAASVAPLDRTGETGNGLMHEEASDGGRGSRSAPQGAEEKGSDAALDRRARGLHRHDGSRDRPGARRDRRQ